jgi:hypothetical protein
MLPGEKFKLDRPAIGLAAKRRRQVLIPEESIIKIVSVPTDHRGMVDVLWDGQRLTMFVLDVGAPGTEVTELQFLSKRPSLFG